MARRVSVTAAVLLKYGLVLFSNIFKCETVILKNMFYDIVKLCGASIPAEKVTNCPRNF